MRNRPQEIVLAALQRDCAVACWLLSLPSQYRSRSYSVRLGQALHNLANRKNVKSAHEELGNYELRTFEMAEPRRRARSRNPVALPRLIEFSHAVLRDTGLELQGEEISPVFVGLERRLVRLMLAAWFVGLGVKREENAIFNAARWLNFSRKSLVRLIGTTASRTNLSLLRKAVVFDGIAFLNGTPPNAVVPVELGFDQIHDPKVISRSELELLAAKSLPPNGQKAVLNESTADGHSPDGCNVLRTEW